MGSGRDIPKPRDGVEIELLLIENEAGGHMVEAKRRKRSTDFYSENFR